MAAVRLSAVFPAGSEVQIVPRRSSEMHVAAGAVASGTVREDSELVVEGLAPGGYWAVVDGQAPVACRAFRSSVRWR